MNSTIRVDKWLWAVRLFKTRTQASEACKGGRIKMAGLSIKPSRELKKGDELEIHVSGIKKTVKVLQITKNRVSAKLVPELMQDLTSSEELEKLDMIKKVNSEHRKYGAGRPTKKERRIIEKIKHNNFLF